MCSIKQSMILPQQNAWIFSFQVSLFLLGPVLDVTGQKTNRCFKNSTVLSELWRQSSWGHDVLRYFLLNKVINQAWLDNKTFTVILKHFNRSFLQNHFNRHYIPTQQPGLRPTRWALHGKGASTTGEACSAPTEQPTTPRYGALIVPYRQAIPLLSLLILSHLITDFQLNTFY